MKKSGIFLFVLLSSVVYPQSKQSHTPDSSVVLNGEDYAFAITVPGGWMLEPGQGTWSGTKAILHPQGVPRARIMWGSPDAWITVGIASKRAAANQTLKNLLAHYARVDSQEARSVSDLPNLVTKDKKTALLEKKVDSQSYWAIAFIEDETIFAVFELRRFDERQFNEALPKFYQIVQSYQSVPVDKKPAK